MRIATASSVVLVLLWWGCGGNAEDERTAECTLFQDSCPEELQCFPGADDPALTVCLAEAHVAQGEACDAASDDPADWCARELLCVSYGLEGADKRCSPLCKTDADCSAAGLGSSCRTGKQTGFKFCSVR